MAVKLALEESGLEYAMCSPDDPERSEFTGYREGMKFDEAGNCTDVGKYVVGSNSGWAFHAAVGAVQIFVRRLPHQDG